MKYASILLDCDGVILDSNQIKTTAFIKTLSDYPEEKIDQFIRYHRQYGGLSRFNKLDYFLKQITNNYSEQEYQRLLNNLGIEIVKQLAFVPFTKGFKSFVERYYEQADIYIVSGGFQEELVDVFKDKKADHYFKSILGSPTPKNILVDNLMQNTQISEPILFVGDSQIDHEATKGYPIDFIFLNGYTDFDGWQNYCKKNALEHYLNFEEMMAAKGWA